MKYFFYCCKYCIFFLLFEVHYFSTFAQHIDATVLHKQWNASWIAVPGEPAKDYGVYLFRKNVELTNQSVSFIVHVSGDNRYKLFVNGILAGLSGILVFVPQIMILLLQNSIL